jgi:transcriptional regulator with XRE-family HTH domain
MKDAPVPNVGPRIRAIREQRGLSMRALAERCDLSVNAISLIERGENSPTVSSLLILAAALDVKVTDFFEPAGANAVVHVTHDQRLATQVGSMLVESLGIGLRDQQLEPFMVTLEPDSRGCDEALIHPGQEFVWCMEGSILYAVRGEHYLLHAGDCLLFDASQPHDFCNPGDSTARALLVFHAAAGSHVARQRHLQPHTHTPLASDSPSG